jgi:hypothetical protein
METLRTADTKPQEPTPLTLESCEALVTDLLGSITHITDRMQQAEIERDITQWRASEFIEENGKKVNMKPRAVAYQRAREAYVLQEESAELAKLADVLLDARNYLDYQNSQNKENIISFNHRLRDVIALTADVVPRKRMESWLGRFMGDNPVEAEKIIAGMGAEVAVYRVAVREFGSVNVKLSDVEQDKRGVDLLVRTNASWKEIDVKTGGNQGGGLGRSHEVDVDRAMIDGFDIRPEYIQGIINQIKDSSR